MTGQVLWMGAGGIAVKMLPTPRAMDYMPQGRDAAMARMRDGGDVMLSSMAKWGLLPTAASDGRGESNYNSSLRNPRLVPEMSTRPVGGGLSPDWTEWLMGWPIGWTASGRLATGRFRSWLRSHSRFLQGALAWGDGVADFLDRAARSRLMARIKSSDTGPELAVRDALRRMGVRFSANGSLPGKPDIALRRRRKAIFVNGCFWHSHEGCRHSRIPLQEYWQEKLARNRERDARALEDLAGLGWDVLTVWECETRDMDSLGATIRGFVKGG